MFASFLKPVRYIIAGVSMVIFSVLQTSGLLSAVAGKAWTLISVVNTCHPSSFHLCCKAVLTCLPSDLGPEGCSTTCLQLSLGLILYCTWFPLLRARQA